MVTLSDSGEGAGLAGASGMDRGLGVRVNVGEGGGLNAGLTAAICKGSWAAGKDGEGERNSAGEVTAGIEMRVGVTDWGGNVRAGDDGVPVTDDRGCEGDGMGEDKNKVVGEFGGMVGEEGVVCGVVVLDGGLTAVCTIAGG